MIINLLYGLKEINGIFGTVPDSSPHLTDKKEIKCIQFIMGSSLYYARAIDSTILPALNDIAIYQSTLTETNQTEIHSPSQLCLLLPQCLPPFMLATCIFISTQMLLISFLQKSVFT